MRITELCESVDAELGLDKEQDPHGLGFDLADDLLFFMHHDDEAYRRHTFPAILKAKDNYHAGKETSNNMFAEAVKECYNKYATQFQITELPAHLDEETLNKICEHLHTQELKKIEDGYYEEK